MIKIIRVKLNQPPPPLNGDVFPIRQSRRATRAENSRIGIMWGEPIFGGDDETVYLTTYIKCQTKTRKITEITSLKLLNENNRRRSGLPPITIENIAILRPQRKIRTDGNRRNRGRCQRKSRERESDFLQ